MKKYKLINSAMMPNLNCTYDCKSCSPEEFVRLLQIQEFESYIGYPETARILEELSGIHIPINRNQTIVDKGDMLLIIRLRYRLANPDQKGKTEHTLDDFEFAVCKVI